MQFDQLKRREFITLLGGAAAAWPLAARAQQPAKVPTIGFLIESKPADLSQRTAVFVQRLRELGWIEGRTVAIEYRWAEGRSERYAEIAAEFVQFQVDVIVTVGSVVPAVKQATSAIPIVFAISGDPIGMGLVASLARPGGNVTGLSSQTPDLAGKRLELLREVVPGLRRLAIMVNAGYPAAMLDMREIQAAAGTLGLEFATSEIRRSEDIVPGFEALKGRTDALYVCGDPLAFANRIRINTLALGARLPAIYSSREYVEGGGLMSYGPNTPDLFRRAADYVDKILRGAKPGNLPIEQPTKFELIINLVTAKALGLTVSQMLLARADEVIEKRREVISLLGGAAAAWPLAARAQQPGMPVVGFLNSASPGNYVPMVAAFRQGLKEAGYVEGQNVAVEYRWAEGHIKAAEKATNGVAVPVPQQLPAVWGLGKEGDPDYDWVRRRLSPHPLQSYTTALTFKSAVGNNLPRTYIHCTQPSHPVLEDSRKLVRSWTGWKWVELAAPHDSMITHPDAVVGLLLGA